MSPHRESPSQSPSRSTVRGRRLGGRSGGPLVAAGLVAALALATAPALAVDLRVATENDFLTGDNQDDLYTFSVALAAERGPYTFTLRENAFTDRQAGRRFDETHLTVSRALPDLGAWSLYAEGGAVHVGRGLFGQEAQNALHRALGQEEVELRYVGSRLHPRLRLEAERFFLPTDDLDVGPRLEADSIPGFRSHAVLGAQARWQSGPASPSISSPAAAGVASPSPCSIGTRPRGRRSPAWAWSSRSRSSCPGRTTSTATSAST